MNLLTPALPHIDAILDLIEDSLQHLQQQAPGAQPCPPFLEQFESLFEEELETHPELLQFDSPQLPDLALAQRYQLELTELAIMWLALAPQLEPRLRHHIAAANHNPDRQEVDLELCRALLCQDAIDEIGLFNLCSSRGKLFSKRLLRFEGGDPNNPLWRPLIPNPQLLFTMRGQRALSPGNCRFAEWIEPHICLDSFHAQPLLLQRVMPILNAFWSLDPLTEKPENSSHGLAFAEGIGLAIEGARGEDHALDLKAICGSLGHNMILVAAPLLLTTDFDIARRVVEDLFLEAELHEELLYFENADSILSPDSFLAAILGREIAHRRCPVVLSVQPKSDLHHALDKALLMRMPLAQSQSTQRQAQLWQGFAQSLPGAGQLLAQANTHDLADRIHLNLSQIRKAIHLSYLSSENCLAGLWENTPPIAPDDEDLVDQDLDDFEPAAGEGWPTTAPLPEAAQAQVQKILVDNARKQVPRNLGSLAQIYEAQLSLEDVVLDQKTTEQISELISAARMRNKVLNEWGLGQRIRRGTGIVVLLDGEPGTGKTQTAEVIAAELNLNVARVDVASLVDKYIGETEKNLSRIFTTVRPDVSMLLFDEADSLFARRSQEGKGANERYSNMNINLLLGLVERYGGITVLTTNLKKAIDPAFERRFTYKIRFSLPEKPERERIWRYLLPEQTLSAEEIDYEWLAEMELSGGEIKNAILLAAFKAVHLDQLLDNDLLLDACRREAAASGRMVRDMDSIRSWE